MAYGAIKILLNSSKILSCEILFKNFLFSQIASAVFLSRLNPSFAINLKALKILNASSSIRNFGFPTNLIVLFFKSFKPPKRSITPVFWLYAIAFIVKSRRDKSSSIFFTNLISFGYLLL